MRARTATTRAEDVVPPDRRPIGMAYIYDRPGFLLRRCHQISVSIFRESCAELDLTPAQFGVLYAVEQNPGIEQIGVATMLGLDRSTTANVVDRLISRDLARREGHAKDRRRVSLTLTKKGNDVLLRAREIAADAQARLLEPLPPGDRARLLALLHRLMEAHADGSRVPFRPRTAGSAGEDAGTIRRSERTSTGKST